MKGVSQMSFYDNEQNNDQHQSDTSHSNTYMKPNDQKQVAPSNDYLFSTAQQETKHRTTTENNNRPVKNTKPSKPSKQKSTSLWSMLLSGVTGGVIVAIVAVVLIMNGFIPTQAINNQTSIDAIETAGTPDNGTTEVIRTVVSEDTESLAGAIQKASEAVVGISNIQQASLWTPTQEAGTGSGVIYKKEDGKAYVVTNNHVVEGATGVEVILPSGEHVSADVLGTDALTDLAVLEMDGSKVSQVATLGHSESLVIGDTAIAIGNPLGTEFAGTVTRGIISGLERSVEVDTNGDRMPDWTTEVIQTDAAINPGNSGGALINTAGEVIGINSMKVAQEAIEGIGFAIPIDAAKPVIEQLETNGKVARPFIGISAVSLSTVPTINKQQTLKLGEEVTDGVVLAEVQNGSPADKAGLQRYDVVTKIDDQEIESMMDLRKYLYSEIKVGETINLTYYREGEQQTTELTLTEQQ